MAGPALTIALAGNPNSGKTTIFNALTGSRQHVGNYPGVTVEKKEGTALLDGAELTIVDLPGTYSLTAHSLDEVVARNFVIEQRPDVVVDIVDATNLQRSLYLATQFMELGVPVVLALNMLDLARAQGLQIQAERLGELLGVPVVETIGQRGQGLTELLRQAVRSARGEAGPPRPVNYGPEVEPHVTELAGLLERHGVSDRRRWFAVKLLEDDGETHKRLARLYGQPTLDTLRAKAGRTRHHIQSILGDPTEIILADRRYGFISGACTECVTETVEARYARTDRIDRILTNRFLGLPIFALLMFLTFQLTFALGNPMVDGLEGGIAWLGEQVGGLWPEGSDSALQSLLVDGVIGGVGQVLVFVPLIALLFLAIAFLEDSGYMARAAFILDHLMHRIGLHGKSFIPMLVGFGCTVPGILATRTLENRRDRLTMILVLPLISCGARLPVYVLILGAFFPARAVLGWRGWGVTNQALLLLAIYAIGVLLAVVAARVLRATVFRGEATPFVMELPPYRLPTLKGLCVHMWERTGEYLKKAGTIILGFVILFWALAYWPQLEPAERAAFEQQRQVVLAQGLAPEAEQSALAVLDVAEQRAELEQSYVGRLGRAIAPIFRPAGFDWRISTALLGSFAAKEMFVSQMAVIYAVGMGTGGASEPLMAELAASYSALTGFCVMLFVLIGTPCVGTVAVTVRESGRWYWAAIQWLYLTALAWLVVVIVYQVGTLVA